MANTESNNNTIQRRPLVWAHRGASGYAPENTLPAFQKAIEMGANGIELDVQMTKDGELVVCHDETINRTSNGSGWIKDKTLAELKVLDFSCGQKDFAGVTIPTMREVFELLATADMIINIELKTGILFYPGMAEKLLELTSECGFSDRVIYSSFNHYTVKYIHEVAPEAKLGFLYADGTIEMPSYALKHGVQALHPALYNIQFPGLIDECHQKGLSVNVWTVNEEEHLELCCRAGVDAIITNYPDRAFEVIRRQI